MATLYQQPTSDHWWIRYCKDGKQFRESTGTADETKAKLQLREVELLLGQHKENGTISQNLAKAIQEEAIHQVAIATVFEARRNHVAPRTQQLYGSRDGRFLFWLTQHHPQVSVISDVDRSMVREFLTEIAKRQEPRTHNGYLRRLRMVFTSAVKDGYAIQDPTAGIEFINEEDSVRRPFTNKELEKLFSIVSGEVRLLTTVGLYAGAMRLSDIIGLTWSNIDLKTGAIRWRMQKRHGKHMEIAIHPRLKVELMAQGGHDPRDPVFPTFRGRRRRASEAFRKALVKAGMKKDTRPDNNRHYKRRKREQAACEKAGRVYVPDITYTRPKDELDFHSLRYNFVSILKTQGCPEAVARSIMGHSSAEVSAIYT
ncbi:MAG: tyrosine-type recombinase/integrase, partial [bacterium]